MADDSDERKTITVDAASFERCAALKADGESWSAFFDRVADAFGSRDEQSEHTVNADSEQRDVLTEAHIDDISARTAKRVVEELGAGLR